MPITEEVAEARAEYGASKFDLLKPDWWQPQTLNIERMNMMVGRSCVVGQNYGGDYAQGCRALGINCAGREPVELGILLSDSTDKKGYELLTQAWTRQVLSRRAKASGPFEAVDTAEVSAGDRELVLV